MEAQLVAEAAALQELLETNGLPVKTTVLNKVCKQLAGLAAVIDVWCLPKRRYEVWSAVHNFDCRASDGSTPASRFFSAGVSRPV